MSIQEILEAHEQTPGHYDCKCGWERSDNPGISHRAHLSDVLDKHMQEREAEAKAEVLREAASAYPVMLRDMVSRGSVAAWLHDRANEYKDQS